MNNHASGLTDFGGGIFLLVVGFLLILYVVIAFLLPIFIYLIHRNISKMSEDISSLKSVIHSNSVEQTEQMKDVNVALKNFNEPIQQLNWLGHGRQ
jgi:hypothetical protein